MIAELNYAGDLVSLRFHGGNRDLYGGAVVDKILVNDIDVKGLCLLNLLIFCPHS